MVRATIRVVVLVFFSNVPAIGLARLVFVHGLQTCRVSNFFFFFVFFSPAWYCVVILPTVGCETVVFRLLSSFGCVCPVFHNRSQRRRDVISFTLLLHYVAPGRAHWNSLCFLLHFSCSTNKPVESMPLCSGLRLRLHIAPLLTLVVICRASVIISVS